MIEKLSWCRCSVMSRIHPWRAAPGHCWRRHFTDGSTWTKVGTESLTGSASVEGVGMFSCAHNGNAALASFSGFGITG
jgi:hypothetical protein